MYLLPLCGHFVSPCVFFFPLCVDILCIFVLGCFSLWSFCLFVDDLCLFVVDLHHFEVILCLSFVGFVPLRSIFAVLKVVLCLFNVICVSLKSCCRSECHLCLLSPFFVSLWLICFSMLFCSVAPKSFLLSLCLFVVTLCLFMVVFCLFVVVLSLFVVVLYLFVVVLCLYGHFLSVCGRFVSLPPHPSGPCVCRAHSVIHPCLVSAVRPKRQSSLYSCSSRALLVETFSGDWLWDFLRIALLRLNSLPSVVCAEDAAAALPLATSS